MIKSTILGLSTLSNILGGTAALSHLLYGHLHFIGISQEFPSRHPTNSVKALKETNAKRRQINEKQHSRGRTVCISWSLAAFHLYLLSDQRQNETGKHCRRQRCRTGEIQRQKQPTDFLPAALTQCCYHRPHCIASATHQSTLS